MNATLFYLHRRLAIVAVALLGLFGTCSGDLRAMPQRHPLPSPSAAPTFP